MMDFERLVEEKSNQYNTLKSKNLIHTPILDKGFLTVLDWMGTDADIARSARISYNNHQAEKTRDQDERLIDYLMEHGHSSPTEQCQIRLHVKMPIFVARQWIRHRTWSVNEISGRYTEMKHEFYIPEEKDIKAQDVKNHQGSEGQVDEATQYKFLSRLCADASAMYIGYTNAVKDKIARETARIGLPLNMYTEMVFSVDLLNLLKFISLRNHKNAQYEIRTYASVLEDIVSALWPMTYASFKRHRKEGLSLSSDEIKILKQALSQLSEKERGDLKSKKVSRGWEWKAKTFGL